MNRIAPVVLLGAVLSASACTSESNEVEDSNADTVVTESAAQNVMQPGLYAVGDGTQIYSRTRLSEDGTYSDLNDAGERVGGGTWEVRDDLMCFDPEGDDAESQERCWTNTEPDPDGSFMTTRVGSEESYRVTPLEE